RSFYSSVHRHGGETMRNGWRTLACAAATEVALKLLEWIETSRWSRDAVDPGESAGMNHRKRRRRHANTSSLCEMPSWTRPLRISKRAYCRSVNGNGALAVGRTPKRYGWSRSPAVEPSLVPRLA